MQGITLMCLAIDMADHRAVQAAFYYGKVIEPGTETLFQNKKKPSVISIGLAAATTTTAAAATCYCCCCCYYYYCCCYCCCCYCCCCCSSFDLFFLHPLFSLSLSLSCSCSCSVSCSCSCSWFVVARFLDLIQLLLVAMGAINYVLGLVSAFKSTAPPARKAADVIGFFIFVGNVAFNILLIKPTEVTIGLYFSSKDLPSPDLIHQLFQYHLVTLIASLALAAQQMISLKSTPKKDVAAKEKKQQ